MPLSLRLPALGYGAASAMWNAADFRGTRDGPAALVTFKGGLRRIIDGAWEGAAIGAVVRGASFGGAGRGAEKCSL